VLCAGNGQISSIFPAAGRHSQAEEPHFGCPQNPISRANSTGLENPVHRAKISLPFWRISANHKDVPHPQEQLY
jgi:hypothetical protein